MGTLLLEEAHGRRHERRRGKLGAPLPLVAPLGEGDDCIDRWPSRQQSSRSWWHCRVKSTGAALRGVVSVRVDDVRRDVLRISQHAGQRRTGCM